MKTLSLLFTLSLAIGPQAFAATTAVQENKIATCTTLDNSKEPIETVNVWLGKGNPAKPASYRVQYSSGSDSLEFPGQELAWLDNGKTMGLRIANFILLKIPNGVSNEGSVEVAMGAPARKMRCQAQLPKH